jgi:hypothetical protein
VPISLGFLLLSAAFLKGYELLVALLPETSVWTSRAFRIAAIEVECLLGLWLPSGLRPRWARRAALATFLGFFAVSMSKTMAGEASCGCFGPVPIPPLWIAALDFVAIVALWRWRPAGPEERQVGARWLRCVAVLLLFLLVGVPGGVVLAVSRPVVLGADTRTDEHHFAVLLEPEKWVGRHCPLFHYADIGEELSQGHWLVVLYHHDCPRCRAAVPAYEARAWAAESDPAAPRVAFIAVPPYGPLLWRFAPGTPCRHGRLNESKVWLVSTPAVIRLQDGVVQPEPPG